MAIPPRSPPLTLEEIIIPHTTTTDAIRTLLVMEIGSDLELRPPPIDEPTTARRNAAPVALRTTGTRPMIGRIGSTDEGSMIPTASTADGEGS